MKSPLLRLPGEIRNRIYGYAFFGENHTENALLKTCKQIEHESKPIYYSHLTLSFGDFTEIGYMIARTQPELLAKIQSIRTRGIPTTSMVWRMRRGGSINTVCLRYASYLPGLRYWHVYEQFRTDYDRDIVEQVKILMGRDVEVTFGRTE